MKKIAFLMCLVFMLALLGGCNAIPDVMEEIDDIGEIVPESGDNLSYIEGLLDDLSDRQLEKVENLEDYEDAVELYEERMELLEEAKNAINDIGEVAPDSAAKIKKARRLYDDLEEVSWEEYVADLYPILTEAEAVHEEYMALINDARSAIEAVGEVDLESEEALQAAREAVEKVNKAGLRDYCAEENGLLEEKENQFKLVEQEHLCDLVMDCLESGDVDGAIENVGLLRIEYPDNDSLDELVPLVAEEALTGVQTAMNNNRLQEAQNRLKKCRDMFYTYCSSSETYKSLEATLNEKLENNRPANGKVLHDDVGGGYGTVKVTAGNMDAVIKLVDVEEPENYKLVYVRANETATFNVYSGTYDVSYATGTQWYGMEELFGEFTLFRMIRNDVEFTIEYSGNYVTYTVYTVTL